MKDEVTKRVAEICDRNRDALLSVVDLLARDSEPSHEPDAQAAEIRHTLERIKAKDCVSADEAALLFGCSAQHFRNQVQRALDNKASVPIPYRDLDGIICFPVVELMEWSRTPKPKEKRGRKNKTHLEALAS